MRLEWMRRRKLTIGEEEDEGTAKEEEEAKEAEANKKEANEDEGAGGEEVEEEEGQEEHELTPMPKIKRSPLAVSRNVAHKVGPHQASPNRAFMSPCN